MIARPGWSERLHRELADRLRHLGFIEHDVKPTIGKRSARMDEAGCPWCITVDGATLTGQTVTLRDRDTGQLERIAIDRVGSLVAERMRS